MNEQEYSSQLSALFDNQLPPAQSEMVIRRALKDADLRAAWGRYALIGACLRGEPVPTDLRKPDVAERVRTRLAAEADISAAANAAKTGEQGGRSRFAIFGRGALGGAIAAGVAVVSLVVVRSLTAEAPSTAQVAAAAPVEAVVISPLPLAAPATTLSAARAEVASPGYTTPVNNSPAGVRLNARLANYVVAHSEVAASAVRFSPLSTVMSSDYDITQGAVEMTAAEIGALR